MLDLSSTSAKKYPCLICSGRDILFLVGIFAPWFIDYLLSLGGRATVTACKNKKTKGSDPGEIYFYVTPLISRDKSSFLTGLCLE